MSIRSTTYIKIFGSYIFFDWTDSVPYKGTNCLEQNTGFNS